MSAADRKLEVASTHTVELREIRKSYDHFVAVDHLSINIRLGSVYGLLGPNGAGKTSTIRMMIGITLPDEGEVRLFGESSIAGSSIASATCRKSAACTRR
jgi:ABC-type multidrug transport system ATPase subunit